jgi:hypothetical protein
VRRRGDAMEVAQKPVREPPADLAALLAAEG